MRLAHEGKKILYSILIVFIILLFLTIFDKINPIMVLPVFLALIFCINFFRDPERIIPVGENQIIAPADGKIINIDKIDHELGQMNVISIFLNVFDVHVNRMPIKGSFSKLSYKKGEFLVAFDHNAANKNERNEIEIDTKIGKIKVIQIAGLVARRIICYAKLNEEMDLGGRLGFMLFGSRIDLLIPSHINVSVKLGQKVVGNRTIIATFE
tara:strand:+ start:1254 stop:1886 length:633 start_codon:yes stop_codon:yes gene_type:complete